MKKNFFSQLYSDFGISGIVLLVVFVLLIGGLGGVLVERLILPYFSTWPIVREFSVLRPDTPIVITKREEVRIQDGVNQVEVVNRVKNSLLTIYSHRGSFDSGSFRVEGAFTGVIVTKDGVIITPTALIEPGLLLTVVTASGDSFPAELLASDPLSGLSFLKIDTDGLPILGQGFSENIQEGERLIAIWSDEDGRNPISLRLDAVGPGTVRQSLVKVFSLDELNISLEVLWPGGESVPGAVLVNRVGELMGIETVIKGRSLAVRGEDIKLLIDNFLDDGKIVWPSVRLDYQNFGPGQTKLFDLPKEYGVLLKSSFQELKQDDFVFAVNGTTLNEREGFQEALLSKPPGSKVNLKLIRDGEEKEVEIRL